MEAVVGDCVKVVSFIPDDVINGIQTRNGLPFTDWPSPHVWYEIAEKDPYSMAGIYTVDTGQRLVILRAIDIAVVKPRIAVERGR